jgi:enoyl-CoA hydratase/carnithine racemase
MTATDDPRLVLVADDGAVRTITFHRPEARNAMHGALYAAAAEALVAADADDPVHVVVLAGAGPAFCAGQDLREMAALSAASAAPDADAPHDDAPFRGAFDGFIAAIETLSKPLIAAVQGYAIGIGTTMLAYCDLVVAADDARFRLPFVPLGVVPEMGSSLTIPQVLGRQAGTYHLLSGAWLDAARAAELGLVLRVVPADRLAAEVGALAAEIAVGPLASLRATKRLIREGWIDAARAARAREEAVFTTLLGHGASRAALDDFLGRSPT